MDILLWVVGSFAGIIVILTIIGFMSPRYAEMSRSIEIDASPENIFPRLNSMREFVKWSPWTEKDPNARHEYEGPDSGIGSKYTWEGDKKTVGSGIMEIIESVENKRVNSTLQFNGRSNAEAGWTINTEGDTTTVTWDFKGDMGSNPAGRLMGRMMDKFLGPQYEEGLQNLKKQCEDA